MDEADRLLAPEFQEDIKYNSFYQVIKMSLICLSEFYSS
jgi:hypothetical protein